MLFEGAEEFLSLYNQGWTVQQLQLQTAYFQYLSTSSAAAHQANNERLVRDALEKYAKEQWEEECGGLGYHEASCLGEWWNDWGDEVILAGAVVVAGGCIAATGPETGGASAAICAKGGLALTTIEVTDSSSKNGLWPGGTSPDWGGFMTDVGVDTAAQSFGGVLEGFTTAGKEPIEYIGRALSQSPELLEAFYDYVHGDE